MSVTFYSRDQKYYALKVLVNTIEDSQELKIDKHLGAMNMYHHGKELVQLLQGSFKLNGPHGEHQVLVMKPLGLNLRTLRSIQSSGVFPEAFVTSALEQALVALAYVHDSGLVHTGMLTWMRGIEWQTSVNNGV